MMWMDNLTWFGEYGAEATAQLSIAAVSKQAYNDEFVLCVMCYCIATVKAPFLHVLTSNASINYSYELLYSHIDHKDI